MHIGADFGKGSPDVCHPSGSKEHIINTKRCRARPVKEANRPGAATSVEATGPCEESLEVDCLSACVPAARLDARKTKPGRPRKNPTPFPPCYLLPRADAQKEIQKLSLLGEGSRVYFHKPRRIRGFGIMPSFRPRRADARPTRTPASASPRPRSSATGAGRRGRVRS